MSTTAVIYAKNLAAVAAFYERTLQLDKVEAESGHILLARGSIEVVVVQVPEEIAASFGVSSPPALRTETPLKMSFLVEDLERAREAARATGGALRAESSAWSWRGCRHLDGNDPEGNVVQFRVALRAPPASQPPAEPRP